jgi:hypothetical protein
VAAAAFAFAWFAHARLRPPTPRPVIAAAAAMSSAAACEGPQAPTVLTSSSSTSIRTVSVADLPLAGRGGAVTNTDSRAAAPSSAGSRRGRAATDTSSGPSRADLVGALSQVASAASGCGERGGPVRVVMSFAPTGVARSIQVSGADLPAQTRSCIIGAASRARVPAFSGDPVTVSKTL